MINSKLMHISNKQMGYSSSWTYPRVLLQADFLFNATRNYHQLSSRWKLKLMNSDPWLKDRISWKITTKASKEIFSLCYQAMIKKKKKKELGRRPSQRHPESRSLEKCGLTFQWFHFVAVAFLKSHRLRDRWWSPLGEKEVAVARKPHWDSRVLLCFLDAEVVTGLHRGQCHAEFQIQIHAERSICRTGKSEQGPETEIRLWPWLHSHAKWCHRGTIHHTHSDAFYNSVRILNDLKTESQQEF